MTGLDLVPLPLDVVLVRGAWSPTSVGLCLAQSLMMRQPVVFSHVILCTGPSSYLQATVLGGVHGTRC